MRKGDALAAANATGANASGAADAAANGAATPLRLPRLLRLTAATPLVGFPLLLVTTLRRFPLPFNFLFVLFVLFFLFFVDALVGVVDGEDRPPVDHRHDSPPCKRRSNHALLEHPR